MSIVVNFKPVIDDDLRVNDGLVLKDGASSEGWHDQWEQVPPG
jgi:hypothetical protein